MVSARIGPHAQLHFIHHSKSIAPLGLTPTSCFGMACFGMMLVKRGDINNRYCAVARNLLQIIEGAKEHAGEVLYVLAEAANYSEPLQAAQLIRTEGEAAALSSGDITFACYNRYRYIACIISDGTHL